MPRESDSVPAFWRYWLMLSHLPTSPRRVSTKKIQEFLAGQGVDIELRSIQRDLLRLAGYFPIEHDERKPRGWSFSKGAPRFDLPTMDAHSALTFGLVEEHLGSLLPPSALRFLRPHFQRANQTLVARSGGRGKKSLRQKLCVIPRSQPLLPPRVERVILEAVYDALLDDRCLRVSYEGRAAKQQMTDALAHPQGILFRDAIPYLCCTLWEYDDVRLLALHRIRKARCVEEQRRAVKGFDIEAFAKSGAAGWRVDEEGVGVVLRFEAGAARSVTETPLAHEQLARVLDDGRVEVVARVPNTRVLRAWLRSFGAAVEVVRPASLRGEMAEEAQALWGMYGG